MKKKKYNNQTEEATKELLDFVWDMAISLYMLLILVVLPFYYTAGYGRIGTDKATFFRSLILRFAWVVLPLLAVTLLWQGCLWWRKNGSGKMSWRGGKAQKNSGKVLRQSIKAYCKEKFSITDMFAAAYGLCVVLSYCFSHYKEEALWGTSGWYMGMIPQLTIVLTYFLISRFWKGHKWILLAVLPVSAAMFLLGYINRFGIYPIKMEYANPSFISTIGNINWYCGYLVTVFFGGFCLLWRSDEWKTWAKCLVGAYVFLGFGTLITQGSASGLLGLAAVLLVSYLLSAREGKRMEDWWMLVVLLCGAGSFTYLLRKTGLVTINNNSEGSELLAGNVWVVFMTLMSFVVYWAVKYSNRKQKYPAKLFGVLGKVIVATGLILLVVYVVVTGINTATEGRFLEMTPLSGNNLFRFSIRWGSSRGATLWAGLSCFLEQDLLHKLFGVGPDCMAAFLYTDGSESLITMVEEAFSSLRLTNAHNEWLTLLVDVGLLGAVSFAGMMVSAIWRYIKAKENSSVSAESGTQKDRAKGCQLNQTIIMACGFCLLAYTANNIVSFQQTMSLATMSIVLGVGEHYLRNLTESNSR